MHCYFTQDIIKQLLINLKVPFLEENGQFEGPQLQKLFKDKYHWHKLRLIGFGDSLQPTYRYDLHYMTTILFHIFA